jgi:hypothetical protein
MDADNSPVRRQHQPRAAPSSPPIAHPVAIERFQTPDQDTAGERYEMRDPFAEVTYRANTFPEMVGQGRSSWAARASSR